MEFKHTQQGHDLSAGVLITVCDIHNDSVQDIHCADHYLGSQRAQEDISSLKYLASPE